MVDPLEHPLGRYIEPTRIEELSCVSSDILVSAPGKVLPSHVPLSIEIGHWCAGVAEVPAMALAVKTMRKQCGSGMHVFMIDDTGQDRYMHAIAHAHAIVDQLQALGVKLDQVVLESQLAPIAKIIYAGISPHHVRAAHTTPGWVRLTTDRIPLIRPDGTWSCPILAAAWTAVRLGLYPLPAAAQWREGWTGSADQVVSILPQGLLSTEASAHAILRTAGFGQELHRVRVMGYGDQDL